MTNYVKGPFLRDACGHHGLILRKAFYNTYIPVQIDYETREIYRDPKTAFAQRTSYEEGGEIIIRMKARKEFKGYWRKEEATNKKFVTHVFQKEDLFYRTGDALRRDQDGRWSFLDRLGDAFRWKWENVSTAEVAEVLGRYPGISEANVYGVTLPHHDGRAGCAALQISSDRADGLLDYADLWLYLRTQLPSYAVPVFLRIVKASLRIHNNKQNKVPLRKEGVDPRLTGTEAAEGKDDFFLWAPPKSQKYVAFERKDWDDIENDRARL